MDELLEDDTSEEVPEAKGLESLIVDPAIVTAIIAGALGSVVPSLVQLIIALRAKTPAQLTVHVQDGDKSIEITCAANEIIESQNLVQRLLEEMQEKDIA